jgi:TetR/AcrR family transcriptional regulator, acrAB operon repressor
VATRRADTTRESRNLLIEAAAELFAEKGYRQTTFADVAARSGISRGSIPWHFGNKEGLLLAVLEHLLEVTTNLFEESGDTERDEGGLRSFIGQIAAVCQLPIAHLVLTLYVEAMEHDSTVRDSYAAWHAALRERIKTWAEIQGDALGLPEGVTPDDLAYVVLGAMIGIHVQWRVAGSPVDGNRAFASLEAIISSALAPRGDAPIAAR